MVWQLVNGEEMMICQLQEMVKHGAASSIMRTGRDGADAAKIAVQWFVKKIMELDEELAVIENLINQKC